MHILVLNGANLNLLGLREPNIYGQITLKDIEERLRKIAISAGVNCDFFQSNSEVELIEKIQGSLSKVDFIVFNPAGFTHTSVVLRDALLAVQIPFVEVHLSNVYQREPFRHHSYFSDIAQGVICGMGIQGYEFALQFGVNFLKKDAN